MALLVSAQAGKADAPSIDLLGGTGARVIKVAPQQVGKQPPALVGDLYLAFANPTAAGQTVRLFYTREGTATVKAEGAKRLPAHAIRVMRIHFQEAAGEPPGALKGTVAVETGPRFAPVERFAVPVTSELAPLGDVRFEPATVVIHSTRWCPGCNTEEGGDVRLYGSGVGQLLAYREAAAESAVKATVLSSGHGVGAQLKNLRPDPHHAGSLLGTVSLDSKPTAGKYTGKLVLSQLVPNAPSLGVEVESRYWVLWTILAVLAGVVLGGLLYRFVGLWRRRRLLDGALKQAVEDYLDHRDLNHRGVSDQDQLIWDLEIDLPLRLNDSWNYWDVPRPRFTGHSGEQADHVTSARSSKRSRASTGVR